jgi:phospholipase/carboxylesterase
MIELVHRLRPAAGDPQGALVLLHGRGADEDDLFGLLDLIDPRRRLVGVTPGGPLNLPPGGRHWYIVPRVGYPEPETFRTSYALLERDLPELTGMPWERTIVGGFSQGTVMAYALGLGAGRPTPAGIIAMSGFIPTVDGWTADLDRPGLPIWISHGRRDPVIPVQFAHAARDELAAAPVRMSYHEHEGAHHVDPRSLAELPAWADEALAGGTRSSATS